MLGDQMTSGPARRQDLLGFLTDVGVPWAIATSGQRRSAQRAIDLLEVPEGVQVVMRDEPDQPMPVDLLEAGRLGAEAEPRAELLRLDHRPTGELGAGQPGRGAEVVLDP